MSSAEFNTARNFVLSFGRYKGKTIDKTAESDDGLLYLDWLNAQTWLTDPLRAHLKAYLEDPTIEKELEELT